MRQRLLPFLTLLGLGLACKNSPPPPATCGAPAAVGGTVATLEGGNAAFASDLTARLVAAGGNVFFSPFSISEDLAMVYAGAATTTAQQMAQTLHFTPPQTELPAAFAAIDCRVVGDGQADGNQLEVANRVYGQQGVAFVPAFTNALALDYNAPLDAVDFHGDADGARQTIDAWVSQQTQGLIPELLQPGDVLDTTRLVLVDAIYFKGTWATGFDPSRTTPGPFSRSASSQVQAPLMYAQGTFGYAATSDFAMLELPYQGGQIAMDVMLPNAVDGLPALVTEFSATNFAAWVGQLHAISVEVTLPRFTIQSRFDLAATLSAMGMPLAFGPGADFSGIDGQHDLAIAAVIHQGIVEVNESGTVAAAATATGFTTASVVEVQTFRATHPFLFVLRDVPTGTLLFVGALTDPTAT